LTELARNEEPGEKPEESDNPYAAPAVEVVAPQRASHEFRLATRGQRLVAAIIDWATFLPMMLPMWLMGGDREPTDWDSDGMLAMAMSGFVWLAIAIVHGYLLVTEGASIGKKLLRIRIVTTEGERVNTAKLLILRTALPFLASGACCCGAGPIVTFVDALFIFGSERRCLHDLLAGTIVIQR
jgi:uncharacterized RDD family membrane protein YckC